jgi:hypothetical protein
VPYKASNSADRLEMRVPASVKERLRRAAELRGQSLTRFALEALTVAADDALGVGGGAARRSLGWAQGTAVERGDIVAPASDLDDWDALRSRPAVSGSPATPILARPTDSWPRQRCSTTSCW